MEIIINDYDLMEANKDNALSEIADCVVSLTVGKGLTAKEALAMLELAKTYILNRKIM